MRAGQHATFVEIMTKPGPNALGEVDPSPDALVAWHQAWARRRPMRGGELSIAREQQPNIIEEFFFNFADVVDPVGDGNMISTAMNLKTDLGLYDIDGVFIPDSPLADVRVVAISKRLAV